MISYEGYKLIHLISIFVFITTLGITLFTGKKEKILSILTGVSSLTLFIAGMGLIARVGITHGAPWPTWIRVKLLIWILLAVGGAIVAKRFSKHGKLFFWIMLGLASLAGAAAIFHIN